MRSFKDNDDRDWILRIDCDAIERVHALTGIDLASPFDGEPPLQRQLAMHVPTQLKVLWGLCQPAAEKLGLRRDMFVALLEANHGSAPLPAAVNVLLEELSDFFRRFGQPTLAEILARTIDLIAQGNRVAVAALATESASSSGSPPESAESTPAHSPSGS